MKEKITENWSRILTEMHEMFAERVLQNYTQHASYAVTVKYFTGIWLMAGGHFRQGSVDIRGLRNCVKMELKSLGKDLC